MQTTKGERTPGRTPAIGIASGKPIPFAIGYGRGGLGEGERASPLNQANEEQPSNDTCDKVLISHGANTCLEVAAPRTFGNTTMLYSPTQPKPAHAISN
jgi:hypothetical protein